MLLNSRFVSTHGHLVVVSAFALRDLIRLCLLAAELLSKELMEEELETGQVGSAYRSFPITIAAKKRQAGMQGPI
jgi:hypothetical protein